MPQTYRRQNRRRGQRKRKVYKIGLQDLQTYFHEWVFLFDEDDDHDDGDEAFARKYEEQALGFLRHIGAMLSIDAFLTIGNDMVYVRQLPPGLSSLQGGR